MSDEILPQTASPSCYNFIFFPQKLDVTLSYIFKYFLISAVMDVQRICIRSIYETNDPIIESYWMGYGIFDSYFSDRKDTLFKDRKSTRLNSSHVAISYAVFCLN